MEGKPIMKTKLLIFVLLSLMFGQLTVVNAQEVDIPDDSVWSLAWSPDSTYIAAARYNGTVEIQSALTGLVEQTLQSGFTSQIVAVAWSPNGTRIAGSNELKSIFLWDANTGLLIRTLQGSPPVTLVKSA
jgi:WD40 repeat protein